MSEEGLVFIPGHVAYWLQFSYLHSAAAANNNRCLCNDYAVLDTVLST